MEVYDCNRSKFKCKTRVKRCGKCDEKISFNVRCPTVNQPLFPSPTIDYRRYTVGSGSGSLANQYTVTIPAGTMSMTTRVIGGGGGGGGQLSQIYLFTGQIVPVPQIVQGGGGGGSGRRTNFTRPYAPGIGFPTTLNIVVGAASTTPTDPLTGFGIDGGDSCINFTPAADGFEDVIAKGGKGGCVGMSTGDGEGIAGDGSDGGNGGGGGGGGVYPLVIPDPVVLPFGSGGIGLELESGTDGNTTLGGDGGFNTNSGSSGSASPSANFGGGGGGGSGVVTPSSGGLGGPPGDSMTSNAGGDFQVQDTGAGGGGAGIYTPELAEVGTIIFNSGGRGAHGVVEVWFTIFPVPS